MTYKKHKKDVCNRGAYCSFLQDPFKPTQAQRYFKKYFEVYESAYRGKNPRYHNREVGAVSSNYGIVLNKVFKRKNNSRKRFCQKLANKSDRLYARAWLRNEAFDIADLKNEWELQNVPHRSLKTIAWCID